MMSKVENKWKDYGLCTDTQDVERHRKKEYLKSSISKSKVWQKNNGHMKGLIKLATKSKIKYVLKIHNMNYQ